MTTSSLTQRMRQLTSLDAQVLAIEDGKAHGHVSAERTHLRRFAGAGPRFRSG